MRGAPLAAGDDDVVHTRPAARSLSLSLSLRIQPTDGIVLLLLSSRTLVVQLVLIIEMINYLPVVIKNLYRCVMAYMS
jgi:hypothetical protein